jgi:cytoplasmic iron level regulating protein YaaA (DUF328/UPF0246 family)
MKKIILLSCSKSQVKFKSPAKGLYTSLYFKMCLDYAYRQVYDKIYILSSKYGLLDIEDIVEPYDVELKNNVKERKNWADKVLKQLINKTDVSKDNFLILAIDKYVKYIENKITNKQMPMNGLNRGEKLHWLKQKLSE